MKKKLRSCKHGYISGTKHLAIILCLTACICLSLVSTGLASSYNSTEQTTLNLPEAINIALKQNPLMKAAGAEINATIQAQQTAWAERWAKISAGYSYTRLKDAPYVAFTLFPGINKFPTGKDRSISWDITITQPLFTGFALSTKQELASLGIDIARVQKQETRLSIIEQVRLCYYDILFNKSALDIANETLKQLSAHLADAQHFFKQGLIAKNDLLKSEVAVAAARQNVVRAESRLEQSRARLNILLNQDIEYPIRIKNIPTHTKTRPVLSGLLDKAIQIRPILKAMRLRLKQAGLGIKLAKSGFWPQIVLLARYEQQGDNIIASHNEFSNTCNSMIMLKANWNIFEWGKTYHQVGQAEDKVIILKQNILNIANNVRLQVKSAWLAVGVALKNISTAQTALKQAKENFRITTLQYKHQIASSTDVIDAQKFLTEAEMNYQQAIYGYDMAIARLKRAVGEE